MNKKFIPKVFGRGYMGDGPNSSRYGTNLPKTKKYLTWFAMMQRCYSENSLERKPTYIGCEVCKEWWNFQVFCEWFDENYYEIPNSVMCLDKDVLFKDNKIYSPSTCVFVPQEINKLLTKRNKLRGDFPIGVQKCGNRFISRCSLDDNFEEIGRFDTVEDAFYAYKVRKEYVIKIMADRFKKYIPEKLYHAMYSYEVEITD